jgi:hypothetical protein
MIEENGKTIVLKVFTNEFEAELAKGILEEEEIKAYISSDDSGGMRPHLQLTLGIRLLVLESDFERAKEILDAYSTFTPDDEFNNFENEDEDDEDV